MGRHQKAFREKTCTELTRTRSGGQRSPRRMHRGRTKSKKPQRRVEGGMRTRMPEGQRGDMEKREGQPPLREDASGD